MPSDRAVSSGAERRVAAAGLLALTALAFVLRLPALAPPSLYLDDVWVAILARDATFAKMLELRPPLSMGFLLLESLARHALSSPALSLQLVPFAASLLLVPAAGYLALRLGTGAGGALAAGAVAAVSPVLLDYSVRAKPYATDALLTLVVLGAALHALDRPSARRLLALAFVWGAAAFVSFPCLLTGGSSFVVASAWTLRAASERRRALAVSAGTALFFGAFYLAFLHGQANAAMKEWWRPGMGSGMRFLASRAVLLPATAFPQGWGALAFFVPVALAYLLARPETRARGVLLLGIYAAVFTAAMSGLYPLDPRTSAFTYPVTVLLSVLGVQLLLSRFGHVADGVLGFLALAVAFSSANSASYPYLDDAPLARAIHRLARPDDAIVLYPHSSWTFAYDAGFPSSFEKSDAFGTRFVMRSGRPGVFLLPGIHDFEDRPWVLDPALRDVLRRAGPRVFYFATHLETRGAAVHSRVQQAFLSAGYRRRSIGRGSGSELLLFTR